MRNENETANSEYVKLNFFENLAFENPGKLFNLIESGSLNDVALGVAVQALPDIPGDRATMLAMEHLLHPDPAVRGSAVAAMDAKMETKTVAPGIAKVYRQKMKRLRKEGVVFADPYTAQEL